MTATLEPAVSRAVPAVPRRVPLAGYLGGVLLTQIVNSALHLAQPLLMVQLSGSMAHAAFFSSFDTAVHMGGSFLGGWPCDKLGARRLLILSTFLRGASLALIPFLMQAGRLTLTLAMAAYTLDAVVRGFTDTAVHAVPLELSEGERGELHRLNSRYEVVFDLGGIAGPLALGAMMVWMKGPAAHWAIPAGFVLSALAFCAIPAGRPRAAAASARGGTFEGLRLMNNRPKLLFWCLGLAILNIYPLRKLLSAFFAKGILSMPAAAGWVGAAFGAGGVVGSLVYARLGRRGGDARWVAAGACGIVLLAVGWAPASAAAMAAAAFLFALTNVGARLALTVRLQEETPLETAGGVTAVARFASNGVSVILKSLVGAAFALGAGPRLAFAAVGAGLGVVALAQFGLAAKLARPRL
jgi:predicted MFS family arabinose efflux permease